MMSGTSGRGTLYRFLSFTVPADHAPKIPTSSQTLKAPRRILTPEIHCARLPIINNWEIAYYTYSHGTANLLTAAWSSLE